MEDTTKFANAFVKLTESSSKFTQYLDIISGQLHGFDDHLNNHKIYFEFELNVDGGTLKWMPRNESKQWAVHWSDEVMAMRPVVTLPIAERIEAYKHMTQFAIALNDHIMKTFNEIK